jgi:hypothetical protein
MFSLLFSKYSRRHMHVLCRKPHTHLACFSARKVVRFYASPGIGLACSFQHVPSLATSPYQDRTARLVADIKTCKSCTLSLTSITPLPDEYQKINLGGFMLFLLCPKFSPEQP